MSYIDSVLDVIKRIQELLDTRVLLLVLALVFKRGIGNILIELGGVLNAWAETIRKRGISLLYRSGKGEGESKSERVLRIGGSIDETPDDP